MSLRTLPGKLMVIIGPSGSGKSTLLAVAGLLLSPTRGQVRFLGMPMAERSIKERDELRLGSIGFIFQQANLVRSLTVIENVALPAMLGNRSRSEALRIALDLLGELKIDNLRNEWPESLSGGEAQRAVVARALINQPALILADEPTAMLDGENVKVVRDLLHTAATAHQVAVVTVTHDPRVAEAADAVYEMTDGVLGVAE